MSAIEVRCKNCNRWLATASVMIAAIKCPRCKMIFEYKVVSSLHLTNAYDIIQAEPEGIINENGQNTRL